MDIQQARRAVGRRAASRVLDGDYFPLGGGLNTMQTPMQLKPGELIGVSNYEPRALGGYARLQGFERYDGRTLPSHAPYYLLNFTGGTPANYPAVGDTVTGATSGATGVVIVTSAPNVPNTSGYLILWNISGTFQDGEGLRNAAAALFAAASGTAEKNGASDDTLNATYAQAAQAAQRNLIAAVPGSGPIRGVVEYKANVYAFRDNAGATAVVMWKATAAGWSQIPAYPVINFSAGSVQIAQGQTVTGATSGDTAVVRRVVLSSGSWDAGSAAGYLVLADGAPAFTNGETLKVGATNVATAASAAAAPALAPGGTYDFTVWNFFGSSGTLCLYGCDGKNNAFEFCDDPQYYAPIRTGMATDTPKHLAQHRGRLWLAYPGGSLQPSAVDDPLDWSALEGAAELGVGFEITGLLGEMSPSQSAFYSTATLFVFTEFETFTITGDGPNWILGPFAPENGASAFSVQRLGQGVFLSERGFQTLLAAQQVGNFSTATISQQIQNNIANIFATAVCSQITRAKSLYRLYRSDGSFVSIGFNGNKSNGITICDLGQAVNCAYTGHWSDESEALLLGGTNGYVYVMDSGTNLDGATLTAFMRTAYHFSKTPSRQKRYRRVQFDVQTGGQATISFAPDYSYGSSAVQPDAGRTLEAVAGGPAEWDVSQWDNFDWDSAGSGMPTFKLEGSGQNVGFVISHSSLYENPHVIQGVTLHESMRRLDRGSNT